MGFKRMRNGEQRDSETVEKVVEVETGGNEAVQDQTQAEQRGTARSNTLPDNIGNLARNFSTPPARRATNAEGMRTKTPGKQAKLSTMGIDVTLVVGSGTTHEKEARE
jgi:hypothetical protein